MRKNYLLLLLVALLFGTGTMRGQSVPFGELKNSTTYLLKIGAGYLSFPDDKKISCDVQAKAVKLKIAPDKSTPGLITSIKKEGAPVGLTYTNTGKIQQKPLRLLKFTYAKEGDKYYLKAAEGERQKGKYLTNKSGVLSFEGQSSPDAVVEIIDPNAATDPKTLVKAQNMLNSLALFQAYRFGTEYKNNDIIGSGLGQYPLPTLEDNTWDYVTYNLFLEGHDSFSPTTVVSELNKMEAVKDALKINLPKAKSYVIITTKSSFEDATRVNSKTFQTKVDIDNVAGPSQPAQYLKATKSGYELTKNKAEASVFYFDGEHLTGVNFGFGLGECKYDQTEDKQKIEITQGKLEKTLDAGSYCLKVNGQYVKFGTNGLSLSANESDSHIFLEEATEFTLNTDALGYASFYAPTAVEIPEDVEVYTGHLNSNNSVVQFKKVATKQIPAETAVLMRKGTSQTSFVVKKTTATPTAFTDNALKGYTVSSNQRLASAYGFTVQGDKLVFKPISDGIRAFKAVIFNNNAGGAQEVLETSFAPTGVEGVEVDENSQEVFDLAGRRVEFPVKGQVYVKGGKKFVQK